MSAFQTEVAVLVDYARQKKELGKLIKTQWIAASF